MSTHPILSKRVLDSLIARQEEEQWEQLIANLLHRLELSAEDKAEAESAYTTLGHSIAHKLNLPQHDVDVFPQGSMRTQTTINQRTKFDLDIVVKLSGPGYDKLDAETMFKNFGKALEGNESTTGVPEPKRRCWRLQYPNKPFYFDVTPAVIGSSYASDAHLRVRDPDTIWAPTNPTEFADWFCERAALRFIFNKTLIKGVALDHANIQPLPQEEVAIDDVLRRTVQLIKLHRDNMYWYAEPKQKETQPISVIIVTLATNAYHDLWQKRRQEFRSPIEVVLAVVEAMPNYILKNEKGYSVPNPKLVAENFADRWNHDHGLRAAQFTRWHNQLERDLDSLLHQNTKTATDASIRAVFGSAGVDAWKASTPTSNVLDGLISSSNTHSKSNPSAPTKPGSSSTLG